MLTAIMVIFSLYILLKIYISTMQIGYVSKARKLSPVLMPAADYLKAGSYTISKERISIVNSLVEYVMFVFWFGFGLEWLWGLDTQTVSVSHTILVVWSFLAIGFITSLPFDIYTTFKIDKRFGFTQTAPALFIKDTIISSVISLIVAAGIVAIVDMIITSSSLWWLYTFIFLMIVVVLMNILFPIVRATFFDKLSPIPEGELKERLTKLFNENGFDAQGLFVSDASKRDSRLNAYFAGLGSKKRVVLYDTLVEKLSIEELEAVLGHELGHYNHKDIIKNIAMIGMMLFVTLFAFGNLPETLFEQMYIQATPAILMMMFMLLSSPLFFILMPLMGKVSRMNEFAADEMGSKLGGRENLVSALKKLVTENKSFPKSHPIYLFFYATHPPVLERFEAMGVDMIESSSNPAEGECPVV
jgi:STE24 endopeptidase